MNKNKLPYLAENMKALREILGIGQRYASTKIGVSQSVYSDYEKGKLTPCEEKLAKFTTVVGMPIEDFNLLCERSPLENIKIALEIMKGKNISDNESNDDYLQTWMRMFKIRFANQ
jgi:transcriptional regulator with XRE-family HTH domain